MTGSLGRVTGRESGRVGGVGTVQENEGFGSHPAVTTKPSFSLHDSRVTRLKGGCAPKKKWGLIKYLYYQRLSGPKDCTVPGKWYALLCNSF